MEIQSPAARDKPRQSLGIPLSKVGFPIRKSADQSFFAAPRGLSQRSTSFIASQRQGIHRMPLRHLIALIINTHREDRRQTTDDGNYPSSVLCRPPSDGIDLKDQLASDRSDGVRSSSRHLALSAARSI